MLSRKGNRYITLVLFIFVGLLLSGCNSFGAKCGCGEPMESEKVVKHQGTG
ncbi:uncharacterized protein YceK [Paenibacillus qinlingensis]|uniref:Uncharacterized protein YceK n=1 Tax=Paenibacillus qinlingensis TaxID=1837343 RepID=A0ABU1P3W5_9BACL|nr:uncharacterized protein YceK [Paenibacillus qinlingensis]